MECVVALPKDISVDIWVTWRVIQAEIWRALWAEETPQAGAWHNNVLDQGIVRRPGCPQWRGEKEDTEVGVEKHADASQGATVTGV